MPNGREHLDYDKDFGKHKYGDHDGTSDCKYGCGCWMGPTNSGGNMGIDPFGRCPGHVVSALPAIFGKPIDKKGITADFINSRISSLESEVRGLRPFKKIVDEAEAESNADLVSKLADAGDRIHVLTAQLEAMKTNLRAIAS